ncbi:hypothetical protein NECAME_09402 [Necator americanus]|uniref:Uncharacterized protein n=1 Tax=Necator americanus TaxID=51031 RepID=W2TE09_NECAM|nr:hypothetical protein NECAME_09402 [Necator americanus]ETN80083.1 hypothetical protein NECAME_09402 [Necator americanus]
MVFRRTCLIQLFPFMNKELNRDISTMLVAAMMFHD